MLETLANPLSLIMKLRYDLTESGGFRFSCCHYHRYRPGVYDSVVSDEQRRHSEAPCCCPSPRSIASWWRTAESATSRSGGRTIEEIVLGFFY